MEVVIAAGCAGALLGAWRRVRGTLGTYITAIALVLTATVTTLALLPTTGSHDGPQNQVQERDALHGRVRPPHGHARSRDVSARSS